MFFNLRLNIQTLTGRLALILLAILLSECAQGKGELHVVHIPSLNGALLSRKDSETLQKGGVGLLSQQLNQIRERADGAQIILVGNSNLIHGSLEARFTEGEAVIDFMNRLGLDALVVGHREFYFGQDTLRKLSGLALFPFLAANLVAINGERIPHLLPYHIVGVDTAIIGIVTDKLFRSNLPQHVKGLKLLPPRFTLEHYMAELQAKGVKNIIVAGDFNPDTLTGIDRENFDRMASLEGIDIFFTGLDEDKIPSHPEPTFITPGEKGDFIGYFQRDTSDRVTFQNLPVTSEFLQPDPALSPALDNLQSRLNAMFAQVIAQATQDFPHDMQTESPLGNVITDTIREHTGTSIVLLNSGAMRHGFPKGPVTKGDLMKTLPFDDYMVKPFDMKGEQILNVLSKSCRFEQRYAFLQVSGIAFVCDLGRAGNPLVEESVLVRGRTLRMDRTYSLALNRYVFRGGDGYSEFSEMDIRLEKTYTLPIRDIVERGLSAKGLLRPAVEKRISVKNRPL